MKGVFQFLLTTVAALVFLSLTEAIVCPPKNEADVTLLPNEDDCKTFYICDNGIPHLMECPDGLNFNAIERVCDLPEHAKCISDIITTTEEPPIETTLEEDIVTEEPPIETTSEEDIVTEEPPIETTLEEDIVTEEPTTETPSE